MTYGQIAFCVLCFVMHHFHAYCLCYMLFIVCSILFIFLVYASSCPNSMELVCKYLNKYVVCMLFYNRIKSNVHPIQWWKERSTFTQVLYLRKV